MKVGLDVSPLAQTGAGTARYVTGLARALEGVPGLELRRLTFGGPGKPSALARDLAWYLLLLPAQASRAGLDVLHCTAHRGPLRSRVPVVVTVHDLAVMRHPQFFPAWTRLYARTWLAPTLRAAERIIAVSEFTKREVVQLAGVPEERVRVVPNATDEVFTSEGPAAEGDYVLAVGTVEPRKNLPRLAEATQRLGLELRVVGAEGWGRVSVGGVRWLGRLPDEEVARLYRGALCLAYPSLYEGFGIPVLEAMRCGTPVVTSFGTAMEEVAAGAAELVDPHDAASIAAGIERVIARRDELRAAGLDRARAYTWEAAAEATAAVYRELAR